MALHRVFLEPWVSLIDDASWEPVIRHLMVIPLKELHHFGIEGADVFIHQVIEVVTPEFRERLGHLRFLRSRDVLPDRAIVQFDLCCDRIVRVDVIAVVDEKVRMQPTHLLVNLHAAPFRIDPPSLPGGVSPPNEGDIPALHWGGPQMPDHWYTQRFDVEQALEHDAVEDLLSGGNSMRSTRAVKSLAASAAGPIIRLGFLNESVVAYSTIIRLGQSVRLQIMAALLVASPLATP
jgi:hypothetical protein